MKKLVALTVFLGVFAAISAFAQQNKVVVIPLNSKTTVVNGGFSGYSLLTNTQTYIMSETDVSLSADGTCVVTSTGLAYNNLEDTDDVVGPYFRTARQQAGGSPSDDGIFGSYALRISGSHSSTAVSATHACSVTANTVYNFGCVFLSPPANWSDATGTCRVTWVCTKN